VNDSTVNVRSRFDATKHVDQIGNVTVQSTINFTLGFACTGGARCTNNISCPDFFSKTCSNSAININMSPISVSISGNWVYDVINAVTSGIFDWYVEAKAQLSVNKEVGGLVDSLDNALTDLDGCPTITISNTSPPDVNFGYPMVCGLQITPATINMCR
jgi:hypothetical protein